MENQISMAVSEFKSLSLLNGVAAETILMCYKKIENVIKVCKMSKSFYQKLVAKSIVSRTLICVQGEGLSIN